MPTCGRCRTPARRQTNAGALTSQGFISHAANKVATLGVTGSGVTVGVLSDSATPGERGGIDRHRRPARRHHVAAGSGRQQYPRRGGRRHGDDGDHSRHRARRQHDLRHGLRKRRELRVQHRRPRQCRRQGDRRRRQLFGRRRLPGHGDRASGQSGHRDGRHLLLIGGEQRQSHERHVRHLGRRIS